MTTLGKFQSHGRGADATGTVQRSGEEEKPLLSGVLYALYIILCTGKLNQIHVHVCKKKTHQNIMISTHKACIIIVIVDVVHTFYYNCNCSTHMFYYTYS